MKWKIAAIICLMLSVGLLGGCVSLYFDSPNWNNNRTVKTDGVIEERTFDEGEFDGIILEGNMHRLSVHLSIGDSGVRVSCDRAYYDALDVSNRNGALYIGCDGALLEPIDVYISTPTLSKIDCRGAAELISDDVLTGDALTLDVAGACTSDLNLDYDKLKISLAGAGRLNLKGSVENLDIIGAGACLIEASDLKAQACDINLAGAGQIKIRCEKELSAMIGGIGTVEYWGAARVNKTGAGLGSVTYRGE